MLLKSLKDVVRRVEPHDGSSHSWELQVDRNAGTVDLTTDFEDSLVVSIHRLAVEHDRTVHNRKTCRMILWLDSCRYKGRALGKLDR